VNWRYLVEHLFEIIACKPLLHRKELAVRYGVDDATIDRWHREGTLPRPIYLRGSIIPQWKPMDILKAETTDPKLVRALRKLNEHSKRKQS
jgi:predicted DNA-binding transcriptional regulator AlpA